MRRLVLILTCTAVGCTSIGTAGIFTRYAGGTAKAQSYSHYLSAVLFERQGKLERAAEELHQAVAAAPDSAFLRLQLVQTYIKLGDLDSALRACEEAAKSIPDDATLWVLLTWMYQRREEYDKAVDAYRQALELQPQDDLGYEMLIQAAEKANDLTTALDMCQRLIELRPDSARLRFKLGYILARMNDLEAARPAVEDALARDSDLYLARNMLGLIYLDLDRNEDAVEQLTRYLEAVPGDVAAQERLAGAYARLGQFDRAIELIEEIIAAGAAQARHHIVRVYLLLRLGRYEAAAAAIAPPEAPLVGTVLTALARKSHQAPYRRPLETLDQVEGEIDVECNEFLGEIVGVFGRESAGEFFVSALTELYEEGIRSRALLIFLGRTYMALEQDREAEKVLGQALEQFGPDKWVHYYLATVYENLDRRKETEKHLKACLELDPQDPEVMNFLGYLYAEEGKELEEAERLLKRALELDPANGFYLDSLGWVYYRKGDAGRAIDFIRRAILNMDNDDAILRDHLGDAYLLRGDVDKALSQWERAIRLDPQIKNVQEKINRHKKRAE